MAPEKEAGMVGTMDAQLPPSRELFMKTDSLTFLP